MDCDCANRSIFGCLVFCGECCFALEDELVQPQDDCLALVTTEDVVVRTGDECLHLTSFLMAALGCLPGKGSISSRWYLKVVYLKLVDLIVVQVFSISAT